MALISIKAFIIYIALTSHLESAADQGDCVSKGSIPNFALKGHQIKSMTKPTMLNCVVACQDNGHCHSINYEHMTHACELNARTREAYPWDFSTHPGWTYLEVLFRKPAPPCRRGEALCRYGFCIPEDDSQYSSCRCMRPFTGEFCDVCTMNADMALGMGGGRFNNSQITASSYIEGVGEPYNARLRNTKCWISQSSDTSSYLQIKLYHVPTSVTRIDTQGCLSHSAWVTEYTLEYSTDGRSWINYTTTDGLIKLFYANTDSNSIVQQQLNTTSLIPSYIRVRPTKWHNFLAMRMEIYGCEL